MTPPLPIHDSRIEVDSARGGGVRTRGSRGRGAGADRHRHHDKDGREGERREKPGFAPGRDERDPIMSRAIPSPPPGGIDHPLMRSGRPRWRRPWRFPLATKRREVAGLTLPALSRARTVTS